MKSIALLLILILGICLQALSKDSMARQAIAPAHYAVFYEDGNQIGDNLTYRIGEYKSLPSGWNDRISSVYVPTGVRVILYEHENFQGSSFEITSNWTVNSDDDQWNDRISSLRILNW